MSETTTTGIDDIGGVTAGSTDASGFTITYPEGGNGRTETVGDTSVEYSAGGALIRERTADGTVLEAFDSSGRPHAGNSNGTTFTIDYTGDGGSIDRYSDGSVAQYDRSGHIVRQTTADGTTYSSFDAANRPTAGTSHGSGFTIDHQHDGGSLIHYADGSSALFDPAGHLTRQTTGDGSTYTDFDAQGRPLAGTANGTTFTIDHRSDGDSVIHYHDGTMAEFTSGGHLVRESTSDGSLYTSFDSQDRPTAGSSNGQDFTISYQGDDTITHYADGTTAEFDKSGHLIREASPDGTVYTQFDAQNRPTAGTTNDQAFATSYQGDDTVTHYADGTTAEFDKSGHILRESTPDGATYTSFDSQGRPTAGSSDGQDFTISYQGDNSITHYADGTAATFDKGGHLLRETTPDGAAYTSFDAQNRPTAGSSDGQSFTIDYQGDNSVTHYADGTTATFDKGGHLLRENTPDGAAYSSFDGQNRPTAGTADGQSFTIDYQGDSSVTHYADGTTATFDKGGHLLRENTPDGAVYSSFDGQNRPTAGSSDGQSFTIDYQGDSSVTHYADGTTATFDKGGHLLRENTPDGATYTSFDAQNRPTAGTADGQSFTIDYQGDNSVSHYADGTTATFDKGGHLLRENTPDGAVYSSFDAQNRPTAGTADGQSFTIDYQGDNSVTHYADGTTATFDKGGHLLRENTPDGAVYTQFDGQNRPTAGTADGQSFTIDYQGDSSVSHYADGTTATFDKGGHLLRENTPDGAVYSSFDGQNRPTAGTADGQSFTIDYQGDESFSHYADGTVAEFDKGGHLLRENTPDGAVYTQFDGQNRPTAGTADGQRFTIDYQGDNSVTHYADGTTATFDKGGHLFRENTPDGATYTSFDAQNRPIAGTADGQSFTIDYQGDSSVTHYADGTTATFDKGGHLLRENTPDGAVYTQFDGQNRPIAGTADGQSFTIDYQGDSSVTHYADGTTATFDKGGHLLRENTPDGAVYSSFDGQNRPTAGTADGQSFTIDYQGDESFSHYADGTVAEFDKGGHLLRENTRDGAVYTQFDGQNRPTAGTADGQSFTIDYQGDNSVSHYADGTTATFDKGGHLLRENTPDGATYTSFDGQNRPTAGSADGQSFTIDYQGDNSVSHYADGTTATFDKGGHLLRENTPDGAVYSSFDGQNRPTAGTADGQSFTVDYQGDHSFSHYTDGTVAEFDKGGHLVRENTPDGAVYTSFDGQNRPTAGTAAGQDFTVTYEGDHSFSHYTDGSVAEFDKGGHIVRENTPDGAVYTSFDGQNRPTAGTADGQSFSITYEGDHSFSHFTDGSVAEFNHGGQLVRETTADGVVYTSFDGQNRPVAGTAHDSGPFTVSYEGDHSFTHFTQSGATAEYDGHQNLVRETTSDGTVYTGFDGQSRPVAGDSPKDGAFTVDYQGDHSFTHFTSSGATVEYDGNNVLVRETTSDGTVYTSFDGQSRPVAGDSPKDGAFTVDYQGDHSITHFTASGVTAEFDANNHLVHESTRDGVEFTDFDAGNRPIEGHSPQGGEFSVAYPSADHSVYTYKSGTIAEYDGDKPVRETTPDKSVFTEFNDPQGRPTHGTTAQGETIDITYDTGGSETTYGKGTFVKADTNGTPTYMRTPDGSQYTEFKDQNRPTHGTTSEGDTIDITYDSSGSQTRYGNGTLVKADTSGAPTYMRTSDGSQYTEFKDNNRPTHGTTDKGETIDITYDDTAHTSQVTYGGGTIVDLNADNHPTWMKTSDGSIFTEFVDPKFRPTHGTTDKGETIDITYDDTAHTSEITYGGGTIVKVDENNNPYYMKTSDGTVFTEFKDKNRPTHGTTDKGETVDITYDDTAHTSEIKYGGGTVVRVDENNNPYYMKTSDGTVFTVFDAKGRPKSGTTAKGDSVDITYDDTAHTSGIKYGNGTVVKIGSDNLPYWMETGDGTVFTGFDKDGRPILGKTSDNQIVTITYDDINHTSQAKIGDSIVIDYDANGDPVKMSQDGFVFTDYKDGHFTKGWDPNRGQNFTIDYLGNGDVKWVYGQDDWVEYDKNGNGVALQTPGHEATTFTAQFDLMATIAKVTRVFRSEISGNLDGMKSWLNDVDLFWNGAAHETFKTYHGTISQASDNLLAALDEAINRLETTHQNYVDAEGQNAQNINPHK